MRIGLVWVALLFLGSTLNGRSQSGKDGKTEILARWHFVGTKQLSDNKDLPTLREILALKQTEDLRKVAVEGFASQIAPRLIQGTETNANGQAAALIKPLLPDLIENETHFELNSKGDPKDGNWFLAVKLPQDRLEEWNKNLTDLANAAKMQVSKAEEGEGWRAQQDSYRLSFTPAKGWLLLEGGSGPATKPRKAPKSGDKEVLSAEINSPALARFWNAEWLGQAPKLNLTVLPKKDALRTEMLIDYPEPLKITPESWNVPTDLIRDPLIGFTAIQGIGGRLGENARFKGLGSQKTPNQAFLWAISATPFTVFAATDVGNPGTVVSNIVSQLLPNWKDAAGDPTVLTNRPAILWRNLPIAVPFIEAADAGHSPFLVGGLFPISTEQLKPAPPELFAQLKTKDLVYYDWEITQERLKQWRPIWQFLKIVQGKLLPASASDHWIEAITPKLGNTITEITLQNPSRLKLVRQSHAGLTGLELVLLAHAIDPNDASDRPQRPPGQPPVRRNPATPKR